MRLPALILCLGLFAAPAFALPKSVAEFKARVGREATEPRAAAKLWFEAVYAYAADRDLGGGCLAEIMAERDWQKSAGRLFVDRLQNKGYLFRSYAKGASSANDYKLPDPDRFELDLADVDPKPFADRPEGAAVRVLLKSSGAEAPRPLILTKGSDGRYRVSDAGGLLVGIRPPTGG